MQQTALGIANNADDVKALREQSSVLREMQPGQQSDLMYESVFETLITGEKGTGKTSSSIIWMIRGNLDVPDDKKTPTDIYYFNNPLYRGVVVRKNVDDLNSWVEESKAIYGTDGTNGLGATYTVQPREFTWKHSGAKIFCTHIDDKEAYMRLTGQRIIRLFWDEITFEKSEEIYEKVFSSVRSPDKLMRAQILLACNPEGPGLPWVKSRFIKFRDKTGRIYKPGEVMKIEIVHPLTKKVTYTERVYHHWTMKGNPIFVEQDPDYQARLASMKNESLRNAYIRGDWNAAGGKFFEFRPVRNDWEPENACHVYDASKVVIQPWWPRLIGLDVGFSHFAAAVKIALSPDGRVWVIDEIAHKGVGSRAWGAALARWCQSDMMGLKTCGAAPVIPIYLSPDAIEQRRDDFGTTAENIAIGIMEVLGPGASEIMDSDSPADDFELRMQVRTLAKMPLKRATNKRHFGWDTIRELMVWEELAEPDMRQYDNEYAMKLAEKDAHEYFEYQENFRKKPSALPRLQISSRLRYLPDAFESAVSSQTDLEDIEKPKSGNRDVVQLHDDMLDAARYGLVATNLYKQITTPLANRVESEQSKYHNSSFSTKTPKGFRIGRGANRGVFVQ